MNYYEKIKDYQERRRKASELASKVPITAESFLQQLLSMSKFANELPVEITYRKNRLQNNISSLVQCVDELKYELQSLINDCGIQIHGLIVQQNLEKLVEEKKNASKSNARLARRINHKRES
jgi:hypothetical protein